MTERSPEVPPSDIEVGLRRVERELRAARRWGAKSTRQMHRAVLADLTLAERKATRAEKRLAEAVKRATEAENRARAATERAERAEAELAGLRNSSTWKAGRAVVAVPARIKRLGRG
jgi:hypothetical protein